MTIVDVNIVSIITSAAAVAAIIYGLIERLEAKRDKQKYLLILNDIHRLRAAMFGYIELAMVIQEVQSIPPQQRSSVDYQLAYESIIKNFLALVNEIFDSGHIVYLFPPKTREFELLNGIRFNLAGSLQNKLFQADGTVAVQLLMLKACAECLDHISQTSEAKMLPEIRRNMKTFSTQKERASIIHYVTTLADVN